MVCSYIYVTLKRYGYIDDDNRNVGMILKPVLLNLIALAFALASVLVSILFDQLKQHENNKKTIFFYMFMLYAKYFVVFRAFN